MANRILTEADIRRIANEAFPHDSCTITLRQCSLPGFPYALYYDAGRYRRYRGLLTSDLTLPDKEFLTQHLMPLVQQVVSGDGREIKNWNEPSKASLGPPVPVKARSAGVTAEILDQRGKVYGNYTLMSRTIQDIKRAFRGSNWSDLSSGQKEALEMIATKIGRIVEGDPNHVDSWRDIAGYATLAADGDRSST